MLFDSKSRYAKLQSYQVKDHRGRTVKVLAVPDAPEETSIGIHLRLQGQRLDHLAHKYLDDPAGYWRICELNNVMQAEMLSEAEEVEIPGRTP